MDVSAIAIGFAIMLGLMLIGLPIAVVMAATGVVGGVLAFGWPLVDSMSPVMWGVMNEPLLTAIPLFILLGEIMLRSGMADRMYSAMSLWLRRLPGGLLHTNIGCSALFAATSGSSVATAATIGTVASPALEARGYDRARSLGSIAAGGTLGITVVMGSIYAGIATPTESAALCVVAALVLAAIGGKLSVAFFERCFVQTARTTGVVLLIVLCAFLLNLTLSLTGAAQAMTAWVTSLGIGMTALLLLLIVFYVLLGTVMDVLSMIVLTIPIAVPVVSAVGVDPV